MKKAKRIILILLPVTLLCGVLLHPLMRFGAALYLGRAQAAGTVYGSNLQGSPRLSQGAKALLDRYVKDKAEAYADRKITYQQALDALLPLTKGDLPQEQIEPCLQSIEELEAARSALTAAQSAVTNGDYAQAIPLFQQAQPAGEKAAFGLQQAKIAYKNSVLEQVEAAMAGGDLALAETTLTAAETILGEDEDLLRALSDVERMQADAAFAAREQEALRLLREADPAEAFAYADGLRQQDLSSEEQEYILQLVRHTYESDICDRAQALRAADPAAACTLLQEGLTWVQSERMEKLLSEIRSALPYYLVDMVPLVDETKSARTGADSTVSRRQGGFDSLSNEYGNSFWADAGSISFSLSGDFASFTGTVAFPQGETSDIYRASATLQVFGDGRLIAEFKDMDAASVPMPFSVPVNGVQELTLLWTSEGANGWKDWGRFATMFDGRLIPA